MIQDIGKEVSHWESSLGLSPGRGRTTAAGVQWQAAGVFPCWQTPSAWDPAWRCDGDSVLVHVCPNVHAQSCPTLCDPRDYSLPGSSVHGIFQAMILEWVAICYSRGSSWPRDWAPDSCLSCIGRPILYHCITWEGGTEKVSNGSTRTKGNSWLQCPEARRCLSYFLFLKAYFIFWWKNKVSLK